jgi:hypothetical protein
MFSSSRITRPRSFRRLFSRRADAANGDFLFRASQSPAFFLSPTTPRSNDHPTSRPISRTSLKYACVNTARRASRQFEIFGPGASEAEPFGDATSLVTTASSKSC